MIKNLGFYFILFFIISFSAFLGCQTGLGILASIYIYIYILFNLC